MPGPDGNYAFRPPFRRVPVGVHQVTVKRSADSATKWVTVTPRVGAIADFRLGATLLGALRLISGSVVTLPGSGSADNLAFEVINSGGSTVVVDTIAFLRSDSTVFCETLMFNGCQQWKWPPRAGKDHKMGFDQVDSVTALARARVDMRRFKTDSLQIPGDTAYLHGKVMSLRFSDGSYISFPVP
jgi:hypothetical protein